MKAKSKTSKKVTKKPAAKKKVTTAVKKKKMAPKSLRNMAAKRKSTKSGSGKEGKSPAAKKKVTTAVKKTAVKSLKKVVAKKRSALTTRKKKASVKPLKKSSPIKKSVPSPISAVIVEETSVTISTTLPANGFPTSPPSALLIGRVTHYYNHSNVAIIEIEGGNLQIGDTIHIKGHTTDFEQMIESMEIDHQPVDVAEAGTAVGVKVRDVVREHDSVYKKIEM